MTHDVSRLKWATDESVITRHANDRANHGSFLKSAEMWKFHGKGQIMALNYAAHGKLWALHACP